MRICLSCLCRRLFLVLLAAPMLLTLEQFRQHRDADASQQVMVLEFWLVGMIDGSVTLRVLGGHRRVRTRGRTGTAWLRRAAPARTPNRAVAAGRAGRPGSSRRLWPGPCRMRMLSRCSC